MANYLLDTNHLSPLVTPGHPLRNRLLAQYHARDHFSIAVPALTEMLYGIRTLPRAQSNLQEWQRFSDLFTYYDIDKGDAERAAELQVILRHRGWQLGTVDALIAAISLRYSLTLLTTDKDFQAISLLKTDNWLMR